MTRTLIVGDVHGCVDELRALLQETGFRRDEDRLVLVGDLVAKGPDSAGVIRLAREFGALAVLGNHDTKLLRARARVDAGEYSKHAELCATLSSDDWAYLRGLPYLRKLALQPNYEGSVRPGVLVVHAGLDPAVSLDAQDPTMMMNMRSLDDGEPSANPGEVPWASRWPGPELVIFGHDAMRGAQRYRHALGLDSGCCYGGALTGALIEGEQLTLHQVKAFHVYQPI